MGAQASVVHSDLMAKAARTNYAGAGGTKMGTWKIEDVADRLSKIDPHKFFEPWEGSRTTLLFEAAQTGGHECLAVIQILKKYATSYEHFLNALSWKNEIGQTPLHVCNHGEAAAALLLAGCRTLNDVDFSKGYTPLLSATARYKASVCAVLKHFGADTEARDIEHKQTAYELANWLRFPIEKGSDECLRVLREEVDLASYAGIQWLYSEEIQNDLRKIGINIVMPNADRPNETDLDLGVLIKSLPEDIRYKAELFDTDLSGSISFEDLQKIDPKRKLVGHHKKGFTMEYTPKMQHAFHESFRDIRDEDKKKVIDKFSLEEDILVESNAPIDENTELKINDLPESLRQQALCWDLANHGTITLGQMRQIDSEFCDRLLSKKPIALDQERFLQKSVRQEDELKQSFARYQRDKYGKSFISSPEGREVNGIIPNLQKTSTRKNSETMGLLG